MKKEVKEKIKNILIIVIMIGLFIWGATIAAKALDRPMESTIPRYYSDYEIEKYGIGE